jgi:Tat protein translocase TatB subunit
MGGSEVLLIFVVALLVFGPRKLPEIGRTIGRTLAEFRKATQDFRVSLEREVDLEEVKQTRREIEQATTFDPPQGPRPAAESVPKSTTPTTFAELAAAQRAAEAESAPPAPPVEDERTGS